MKRIIIILLTSIFSLILGVTPVLAWNELASVANGYSYYCYYDAEDFSTTIDSYTGWNTSMTSYTPYATWLKEESEYGYDDSYFDANQLSLLVAHGDDNSGEWTVTQIYKNLR